MRAAGKEFINKKHSRGVEYGIQTLPDPGTEFFHPRSRVKKAPDPRSGSATKNLSILPRIIVTNFLLI
jgi:hypothetical protein